MQISIIVAVSVNNCIGKDNKLLWQLPVDMAFFKEKTLNHCVLMGSNTYRSIPSKFRPLPKRTNIVLSRKGLDENLEDLHVVTSLSDGINKAKLLNEKELFIIGGAEIYRQSIDRADTIYLTRVHVQLEGDAFFPELDLKKWTLFSTKTILKDEKNEYDCTFEIWNKN
ncbi:MAG: dihydrofolate reductase [Bacteroidetes bacterium]|nr:dihydrofolate reductase [Bacteroidota bacterium]